MELFGGGLVGVALLGEVSLGVSIEVQKTYMVPSVSSF